MGKFDDILKRAAGFVDRQKGRWDNAEWLGFLADIRQKGTGLSQEAEDYLGLMLESMKRFYRENGQTQGKGISESLSGVSQHAAKFVHQSKGMWDHSAWEKFLKDVQKAGVKLSGETTAYVGEILEASKRVYEALPGADSAAPAKKKAAAAAPKPAAPKPAAPKAAAPKAAAPKPAAPKQKSSGSNGVQRAKGGLAKTPTKSGAKSSSANKSSSAKKSSSTAARVVTAPAKKSNGKPAAPSRSSAARSSSRPSASSKKAKRKSR